MACLLCYILPPEVHSFKGRTLFIVYCVVTLSLSDTGLQEDTTYLGLLNYVCPKILHKPFCHNGPNSQFAKKNFKKQDECV